MQLDVRPRMGGKTTAAIEWAAKDPAQRVIVSPDIAMAMQTYRTAVDLHPKIEWEKRNFIGFTETRSELRGRRHFEVWIDNADIVLGRMFGLVQGASWTLDEAAPYSTPPVQPESSNPRVRLAQRGIIT